MNPDETFRVERSEVYEGECWILRVRSGESEWDWTPIYYATTERQVREKLQWFVDRMKAYVVGV